MQIQDWWVIRWVKSYIGRLSFDLQVFKIFDMIPAGSLQTVSKDIKILQIKRLQDFSFVEYFNKFNNY